MRRARRHGASILAVLLLWSTDQALAEQSALLVGAREVERLPPERRAQVQHAVDALVAEVGLVVQRSPLTIEQLALAVGCDARTDVCLLHLSRHVAKRRILVPTLVPEGHGRGVQLKSISGDNGVSTVVAAGADSAPGRGPERATDPAVGASLVSDQASPDDGRDRGPSQPARIVGTAALSASAVMLAFGISRLVRSRHAAKTYARTELDTADGIDRAHDLQDEATHDARVARGVLSGAALVGLSGLGALLWHRLSGSHANSSAPVIAAQVSPGRVFLAIEGSWGTRL